MIHNITHLLQKFESFFIEFACSKIKGAMTEEKVYNRMMDMT